LEPTSSPHQHSDVSYSLRLLRTRCKRPPSSRTAEQRDELAPFHSMISSAMASSGNGMVTPSDLGNGSVDDQLEFGRLHDRQVAGLLSVEDAASVSARLAVSIRNTAPIAHQTANDSEFT
jgi:hypothetical protein